MEVCQAIVQTTGCPCVYRSLPGLTTCGVHRPFQVDTCAICLDEVFTKAGSKRLKCGHVFHGKCIMEWFNSGNENSHCCATCRAPWRAARKDHKVYTIDPDEAILTYIREVETIPQEFVDAMDENDPVPIVLNGFIPNGGVLHIRMNMDNWRSLIV